jgi:hypothetical protein
MAKHLMGRDSQSNKAQTIAVSTPTERMPQNSAPALSIVACKVGFYPFHHTVAA